MLFLKERRLHDLKKKNQDLKKFKFVLDYKIEELRKTIEPKEREISMLKEQIDGVRNINSLNCSNCHHHCSNVSFPMHLAKHCKLILNSSGIKYGVNGDDSRTLLNPCVLD